MPPETTPPAMHATVLAGDELEARADRALAIAARVAGADAVEVRVDARANRRVAIDAKGATQTRASLAHGLGVLVTSNGATAYAHTTDDAAPAIRRLVEEAVALARARARMGRPVAVPSRTHRARYAPQIRRDPVHEEESVLASLVARAREAARAAPGVEEAHAIFGARSADTVILDTSGSHSRIGSLLSTLYVTAVTRASGRLGSGSARAAGEQDARDLDARGGPEALGRAAAERAVESAAAVSIPSGRYRVLCDNELSGTLAHESFGHLTEHDLVASGWSTLRGRRGETLAPAHVSITDAPIVTSDPKQGVAVPFDDQGTTGRPVTVLHEGKLSAWLHSRETAAATGEEPLGNGRALDARFPAIVRMRNTYFEPGEASVEDALEALGDGLYLCGARGGAPHSDGSFMFTAIRGSLVKGGRIESPVRNLAVHGSILDFLQNVEMTTRDFEVSTNYFGGCGKREQSFMHVGVGGPHVLVREALVGGV